MRSIRNLAAAIAIMTAGLTVVLAVSAFAPVSGTRVRVAEYLPPALRLKVEELKRSVAAAPTTKDNIAARLETFWNWSNAYAVQGYAVDPDLTYAVAIISTALDPKIGGEARLASAQRNFPLMDAWVRELSLREERPLAVGTIEGFGTGPFPVDGYASYSQVFTVGERGLGVGDGFVVATRAYGGGYDLQTSDPAADNYLSVVASNPDVMLEIATKPIVGMFSGTLGGVNPRPFFRITAGALNPGDTVTFRFGDTRQGSKGVRMPTTSTDALRMRTWIYLAAEDTLFSFDEVHVRTQGLEATGVRGFAPSVVATNEPFEISVRSEDKYRNRATSGFPVYTVKINGKTVGKTRTDDGAVSVLAGLKLDDPGIYRVAIVSEDGRISGKANPILVENRPASRIYWGETHGHSGYAEGMGTVDGYYAFARDDARLDFTTLSEHDLWMDDLEWNTLRAAVRKFNEPGRFVAFLGYEWTVNAEDGGHHNVIYRSADMGVRMPRQIAPYPDALYRGLKTLYRADDVHIIPHAHQPGDWKTTDPDLEKFVEITSNHGTFEWFGRRYLDMGYKVGFLGGSDDHIGHPGLRALRANSASDNFGGLAAIRASAKTDDAIFDAIREGQGYATNGRRIILEADLDGARMGQHAAFRSRPLFKGRVIGDAPIERITILKNGAPVEVEDFAIRTSGDTDTVELQLFSESEQSEWGEEARGWRVWRGTIDVANASLISATAPKNENVFTEFVRIAKDNPNRVEFFLRTRGSTKGVVLKLTGLNDSTSFSVKSTGAEAANAPPFSHTFQFKNVKRAAEQVVMSAPMAKKTYPDIMAMRAISAVTQDVRSFSYRDTSPSKPGDVYYVRIEQTDGGMAWSSPIWNGAAPTPAAGATP